MQNKTDKFCELCGCKYLIHTSVYPCDWYGNPTNSDEVLDCGYDLPCRAFKTPVPEKLPRVEYIRIRDYKYDECARKGYLYEGFCSAIWWQLKENDSWETDDRFDVTEYFTEDCLGADFPGDGETRYYQIKGLGWNYYPYSDYFSAARSGNVLRAKREPQMRKSVIERVNDKSGHGYRYFYEGQEVILIDTWEKRRAKQ